MTFFFSSFYFVLPARVFVPDRMRSRDDAASCSRRSPPLSSRRRPSRSPRRRTSRSPLPRRRCVPAVSHLSLIVFNLRTFNRVPLRLSFNSLTLESFFFYTGVALGLWSGAGWATSSRHAQALRTGGGEAAERRMISLRAVCLKA